MSSCKLDAAVLFLCDASSAGALHVRLLSFAVGDASSKKQVYGKTRYLCNGIPVNKRTLASMTFTNDVARNAARVSKSKRKEPVHLVLPDRLFYDENESVQEAVCSTWRVLSVWVCSSPEGVHNVPKPASFYGCHGDAHAAMKTVPHLTTLDHPFEKHMHGLLMKLHEFHAQAEHRCKMACKKFARPGFVVGGVHLPPNEAVSMAKRAWLKAPDEYFGTLETIIHAASRDGAYIRHNRDLVQRMYHTCIEVLRADVVKLSKSFERAGARVSRKQIRNALRALEDVLEEHAWDASIAGVAEASNSILRSSADPHFMWKYLLRFEPISGVATLSKKLGVREAERHITCRSSSNPPHLVDELLFHPTQRAVDIITDEVIAVASGQPVDENAFCIPVARGGAISALRCVPSLFVREEEEAQSSFSPKVGSKRSLSVAQAMRLAVAIAALGSRSEALNIALDLIESVPTKSWAHFLDVHLLNAKSPSVVQQRLEQIFRVNRSTKLFQKHNLSLSVLRHAVIFMAYECTSVLITQFADAAALSDEQIGGALAATFQEIQHHTACAIVANAREEVSSQLSLTHAAQLLQLDDLSRADDAQDEIMEAKIVPPDLESKVITFIAVWKYERSSCRSSKATDKDVKAVIDKAIIMCQLCYCEETVWGSNEWREHWRGKVCGDCMVSWTGSGLRDTPIVAKRLRHPLQQTILPLSKFPEQNQDWVRKVYGMLLDVDSDAVKPDDRPTEAQLSEFEHDDMIWGWCRTCSGPCPSVPKECASPPITVGAFPPQMQPAVCATIKLELPGIGDVGVDTDVPEYVLENLSARILNACDAELRRRIHNKTAAFQDQILPPCVCEKCKSCLKRGEHLTSFCPDCGTPFIHGGACLHTHCTCGCHFCVHCYFVGSAGSVYNHFCFRHLADCYSYDSGICKHCQETVPFPLQPRLEDVESDPNAIGRALRDFKELWLEAVMAWRKSHKCWENDAGDENYNQVDNWDEYDDAF